MLSTYVTLAFPELVNRTKIVADMTKADAQGVAGGGEGCEGLRLSHFDHDRSASQICNLFDLEI